MAHVQNSTNGSTYQNQNSTSRTKSFQADEAIEHKEGEFTKMIENQTAKIPSGVYLGLALGSMAFSLGLALIGNQSKGWANFVGQWAPSFLIMGLYNKIVKVEGSDRAAALPH